MPQVRPGSRGWFVPRWGFLIGPRSSIRSKASKVRAARYPSLNPPCAASQAAKLYCSFAVFALFHAGEELDHDAVDL
jgi:hypothetical protein